MPQHHKLILVTLAAAFRNTVKLGQKPVFIGADWVVIQVMGVRYQKHGYPMFLCKCHLALHTLAECSSHDPKLIGLFKQGKAKLQALFALLRNGIIAPLTENNMGCKRQYASLPGKAAVFHRVLYIGVVIPTQGTCDIHHFQKFSPPKKTGEYQFPGTRPLFHYANQSLSSSCKSMLFAASFKAQIQNPPLPHQR
ncbi:hypothetical protein SDC9_169989 [bioreactor metagenome]|uniref:Uncharacterized protein n=1 Tax=bioreactor metagenome TaxID=1076179 RepID=A0A645G914_9ZZZZ